MELIKKEITLMGPGPSDVPHSILEKMAFPTIGHLDPYFVSIMDDINEMLRVVFKTKNSMTFPISAPGSAGMEAAFSNLLERDEKVIILQNGVFGGRMQDMAERQGLRPALFQSEWGKGLDLNEVEDFMKGHEDAVAVAFVHAETSTGVLNDCKGICELARKYKLLTIVDTVTSLGGSELEIDGWGVDVSYSGSQKCLSAPPGISPMTFSEQAMEKIRNRKSKPVSWFLDINLLAGYWQGGDAKRSYHHTAPVNAMFGLHEALSLCVTEGVETRWKRHREMHELLVSGLEGLGLELFVERKDRVPQLNAITIPEGLDDASVRGKLMNDFHIEIGGGLGPLAGKVWRVGLMGASASRENIDKLLSALKSII